ncbi:hypothetical protein KHQ81_01520 [Mycoplasmatota bacterium]|nr:hypothetical protein KHQ81_01520 [Mycoplasmatota bacterium]
MGGIIIFKNIKTVKNNLKHYRKIKRESLFSGKKILSILYETMKSTKVTILLIILTIFIFSRPINRAPKNYEIYFYQVLALVLLSVFIIHFLITFYKNISQEYFYYFERSFLEFNRLMKTVITFIFIIIVVIIANIQIFYINHFLTPSLETCSFYDWYGNKIYQHQDIGTCPKLLNITTKKDKNITFGVINEEDNQIVYIDHKYFYENNQLLKRQKTTYVLTKQDIKSITDIDLSLLPILEKDTIENIYNEIEFSSNHINEVFNEDGIRQINKENNLVANLIENKEIVVKKDSSELFRLQKHDDTENQFILHNLYSVQKWPNDTVKETYYNRFSHADELEVKSIEYQTYISPIKKVVTYYKTPVITSMIVDNTFHRFSINYNTVETKIASIDHYINEKLLYKNIFTYTDYGYLVKHYSYERNVWGRILDADERSNISYCYCLNDIVHTNDFDYENVSDNRVNFYCSAPLFYTDNPLFLN